MAQNIFNNSADEGLIALTKLRNKYGRDFLNNTDYFDNLDVDNIKFDEMVTDLHVMTKTENGEFVSEPLNVVLSRMKATGSLAKSTKPGSAGLTEAEQAMKEFWFSTINADIGLHTYVNTEPDANKPKKMEVKFVDLSVEIQDAPEGEAEVPKFEQMVLTEGSLEDRSSIKLKKAKAAGRHCDSKGWLNFKKFFSGKATKERLQKEFDDYQTLKVTVAQDEIKYRAATQSKCITYSSKEPDKIAAIAKETFEANKREVAKYNETEKIANMQLAAKVIAKCVDKLPDYETMHAHYVNALIDNEGFNKHTMGQTQSILGNEKEETELIKYINQPNKLESIRAAAKESYAQNGAISFGKAEPENVINENAPGDVENDIPYEYSKVAQQYISYIAGNPRIDFFNSKPQEYGQAIVKNNAAYEKYFKDVDDGQIISRFDSNGFEKEMFSEKNIEILKYANEHIGKWDGKDLGQLDILAKKALKEATLAAPSIMNKKSADYVAERVLDALALNNESKISAETKTSMKNAISSKKAIKSFVDGKTIDDIKSMQNDPKKKHEYQDVINSVLKEYNPTLFDNKAARPKPIEKKPNAVAPKNRENII